MVKLGKFHVTACILIAISMSTTVSQNAGLSFPSANVRSPQEFHDAASGLSSLDLVRRALASNGELAAARLVVERARGRLRQAGLFPNPTLDVEQTTGRWTGSPAEKEQNIGVTVPIELGGKRGRRIDVAQAEFEAAQAEVADRERQLIGQVRIAYADAMATLRQLEVTSDLNAIDRQTVQVVQARVTEGDAPPLELSLLRADSDRLVSRRALIQGRLEAAVLKLKSLAAVPVAAPLRLKEDVASAVLPLPLSLEDSLQAALLNRPDLKLARLTEEVAAAGLRLARAQIVPDLTLVSRYTISHSAFDNTPVGVLLDRDKLFSFGASITIPILNRNQGARIEATAAVEQARQRREFLEALVRAEVTSAYSRYNAARSAIATFEQGVIQRSADNIRAVRGGYEVGAFRVTELLAEQRRVVDYQFEYTEALAESYRALSDLNTAMAKPINP